MDRSLVETSGQIIGGSIDSAALPAPAPDLAKLGSQAADFARNSRAKATAAAYRSDWRHFEGWCARSGLESLPATPATVGAYLADNASHLKFATLARRVAAIAAAHRLADLPFDRSHPAVAAVLSGIQRRFGSRSEAKTALPTEDLRRMVRALPATTLVGLRDRAVLLVGFAGAFRRSELIALDRADVEISAGGAVIVIRRSKTDQGGAGRELGIPRGRRSATCPVVALEAWLSAARIVAGPIFQALDRAHRGERLSGQAVAEIIKRAARRIGLDPGRYAGHSLRSGFATSAARGGAELPFIMQQTGHKSSDVARRYVQQGRLLANPASKAVDL
jgi:integrase